MAGAAPEDEMLLEDGMLWEVTRHRATVVATTKLGRWMDVVWGPQSGGYIPQVRGTRQLLHPRIELLIRHLRRSLGRALGA